MQSNTEFIPIENVPKSQRFDYFNNEGFKGLKRQNGWIHVSDGKGDDWDSTRSILSAIGFDEYESEFFTVGVYNDFSPNWNDEKKTFGPNMGEGQDLVSKIRLQMRVDEVTPPCLKCDACYDMDGAARTVEVYYNTTTDTRIPRFDPAFSTNTDYETRTVSACPDYCFSESNKVKSTSIKHLHQFAMLTNGFEDTCPPLGSNESLTACQGRAVPTFHDLPKNPVYRIGGTVHRGFFVPPQTANYTFQGVFHGQAEVRRDKKLNRGSAATIVQCCSVQNPRNSLRSLQNSIH